MTATQVGIEVFKAVCMFGIAFGVLAGVLALLKIASSLEDREEDDDDE